ncbi:MAG TPA: PLDc N-terminal domain-containing protein [Chitinophagaceae bacterium]|nr:PLDc N-terminal domain-containing protein [Chitinophagaceae bacterium]
MSNVYYITIALQAICVIHCIRSRSQTIWIWVIIFLPVVGCIAYIFMEMLSGKNLQRTDLWNVFTPRPSIRRLEENLRFSDTFNNRVLLADAYLANGQKEKAIELYESSLTGAFEENEYVQAQLIVAYSGLKQYDKVVTLARKICNEPTFQRSRIHMLYAMALDGAGQPAEAEKEFLKMQSRFSFYETRYQYGLFLIRSNRKSEATNFFESMLEESTHLSPRERRNAAPFLRMVRDELKAIAQNS